MYDTYLYSSIHRNWKTLSYRYFGTNFTYWWIVFPQLFKAKSKINTMIHRKKLYYSKYFYNSSTRITDRGKRTILIVGLKGVQYRLSEFCRNLKNPWSKNVSETCIARNISLFRFLIAVYKFKKSWKTKQWKKGKSKNSVTPLLLDNLFGS